tara:strand:- start:46 stop:360 length:315 start_codon:yes stop_codon:yes gene_type:complete
MITFTDKAINVLKSSVDPPDYIRIGVAGGGCAGFSYVMEVETESSQNDRILEFDELKVCIDPKSFFMLSETTIDYEETLAQSGFKFINEQATKSCGCGKSFSCG